MKNQDISAKDIKAKASEVQSAVNSVKISDEKDGKLLRSVVQSE